MSEKPIIFNGEMVRALLAGRKSMTRRVMKLQPSIPPQVILSPDTATQVAGPRYKGEALAVWPGESELDWFDCRCPYGNIGDKLWVKENWAQRKDLDHLNGTQLYEAGVREAWYWADGPAKCSNTGCNGAAGRVRTARFMPRWASRITLEITDIRVERVQDIGEVDSISEGVTRYYPCGHPDCTGPDGSTGMHYGPRAAFRRLWESINAKKAGCSWNDNPWVWVITFERVKP